MNIPETRFVYVEDERVAYQVSGDGPVDIVFCQGTYSHVDLTWEDPLNARFLERLGTFARVIRFDRRGTGASDPLSDSSRPWWEHTKDDLRAVLDEVGSERAAIVGYLDGAAAALGFAAAYPDRMRGLILMTASARFVEAPDYPIGLPMERLEAIIDWLGENWGTPATASAGFPSRADDPAFVSWMAKFQRVISSAAGIKAAFRSILEQDVRDLLSCIACPTLVLHTEDNRFFPAEHARYLAENIPGADLRLFPGADNALQYEHQDAVLELLGEFLTGARPAPIAERVLATVLFTDIVGSTERASAIGDHAWQEQLTLHDEICDATIRRFGGRRVKSTGDGALATFDGPGRAIACAQALIQELKRVQLEIRIGVHTGEVELRRDGDVGGIAVHIGARIMDLATAGEVLVSRTVRDLVSGSGICFNARGSHTLKGVPEEWELLAVV